MNYRLKITVGIFKKTGVTSALNLFGLTSAFTAFTLIMLYVWNEYQFDQYHVNAHDIYRLEYKSPTRDKSSVYMLGPTAETLKDEYPEILHATTYMPWGKWGVQPFTYENTLGVQHSFEDYAYADENLTDVFSFHIVAGENRPLEKPATAFVNETFAHKAWGNQNPVGKVIKSNNTTYTVMAVFEDLPENSVFTCPVILKIPTTGFIGEARTQWNATNYPQYILLKPQTDINKLNEQINKNSIIREKYSFGDTESTKTTVFARPLKDLRFTQEVTENPLFQTNSKTFVDSLFVVGILILLVALINYINFTTANLSKRMKTFNVNRIIGGGKWDSAVQLLIESILTFVGALVFAFLFAYTLNNSFSTSILGYQLPFVQNIKVLIGTIFIGLLSAIIAGIYPAFASTMGKPIQSLKRTNSMMSEKFRGSLTVFQFAATIALIVASLTVLKQVQFMEKYNLGFDKSNTLVVPINDEIRSNYSTFRAEMLKDANVSQVAASLAIPGRAQNYNTLQVDGQSCFTWNWAVGDYYLEMMQHEIIKGRGFINESDADKGNYICNETAAKRYKWDIGTKINDGQIVGIMKDFNMVSLRENVDPFVYHKAWSMNELNVVTIKLRANNSSATLTNIKETFEKFSPEIPFRGFYLDDQLNLLYAKENQQAGLITFFSLLSAIVSMLGILGLSIFMCQQKIKEIGIRKVNGAKMSEVMLMLNQRFVKWVLIAFLFAIPLAWFAMNKWLENFAYKTDLSWWIFALAGVLALGIALLTVSWQSWKAATRNPVEALRYE